MSADSVLAAVYWACSCCRVRQPYPRLTIWSLTPMRLVMVLLVSDDRVWVGVIRARASVSERAAEALTTAIPAVMASFTAFALAMMADGTGGLVRIAAFRALTLVSTAESALAMEAPSLFVRLAPSFFVRLGVPWTAEASDSTARSCERNFILSD